MKHTSQNLMTLLVLVTLAGCTVPPVRSAVLPTAVPTSSVSLGSVPPARGEASAVRLVTAHRTFITAVYAGANTQAPSDGVESPVSPPATAITPTGVMVAGGTASPLASMARIEVGHTTITAAVDISLPVRFGNHAITLRLIGDQGLGFTGGDWATPQSEAMLAIFFEGVLSRRPEGLNYGTGPLDERGYWQNAVTLQDGSTLQVIDITRQAMYDSGAATRELSGGTKIATSGDSRVFTLMVGDMSQQLRYLAAIQSATPKAQKDATLRMEFLMTMFSGLTASARCPSCSMSDGSLSQAVRWWNNFIKSKPALFDFRY